MSYEALFNPIKIRGLELKNRVVLPGMNTKMVVKKHGIGEDMIAYHVAKAKAGCALNIFEVAAVCPEPHAYMYMGLYTDKDVEELRKLTDAVHEVGGLMGIQLWHGGFTPQLFFDESNKLETPDTCTVERLQEIEKQFGQAAKRAVDAGFDVVEFHAAHSYLPHELLSPGTNHRTDEFGGSAENRFRFAGECLSAIRQAVGKDYPILVKVNTNCAGEADEAYAQDILYFCRQFEALGADAIELSGYNWLGLGKKKVPTFYLDRAVQIRQAVSIPLILVGGVRGPETAQQILDAGIDFVSASRPFICQPDFVRHLEQGEDSPCVGCTKCLGNIWSKEGRRCIKHEIPAAFANNQA